MADTMILGKSLNRLNETDHEHFVGTRLHDEQKIFPIHNFRYALTFARVSLWCPRAED